MNRMVVGTGMVWIGLVERQCEKRALGCLFWVISLDERHGCR